MNKLPIIIRPFYSLLSKFKRADIFPFDSKRESLDGRGFQYKGKTFIHHSGLLPNETAFHRLNGLQIFTLITFLLGLIVALKINWHLTLTIFIASITILYFADLLFNLFLIIHGYTNPAEINITKDDIHTLGNKNWPSYTVLCPLYKEAHVVPQFITSMSRLDYPKDKLQVMLILEEDDQESIKQIRSYILPSYFTIVVVPHSMPKTKPKACNYGLTRATGEYIVIYDAEDIPDSLQLKKAVLAFEKGDKKTVCVQAKLNFYNPHQNLLTRVFSAEYSLWFDLVLTGLQSIQAPIPLGGTSNHFRKADLQKLRGWDSFNVTEDADLGMRLVKQGYNTAIIDSITLEEANSSLSNWFWQRSRWIKGYMQTYLVHMRNPFDFAHDRWGLQLITFQLVIGGKIMSMFINPMMWIITITYFMYRAHFGAFIEGFFPMPIFYMGIFSLILGNFLYVYYYVVGCIKHEHDELVKYVFLVPFYWLAMSAAAWVAGYKLLTAPHHWSKTKHGLYLNNKKATKHAKNAIGDELVDNNLTSNIPAEKVANKASVSICIPAYNEQANIDNILKQIYAQKQKGFIIENIVVVSDGSTDNTVKIAQKYINKGVKIIEGNVNKGQTYRQNEIISMTTSDILVMLNADLMLGDNEVIARLIAPLLRGADLSAQWARPFAPHTLIERILYAGFELKYFVYKHHRQGNNIYTCVGHMRALSRRFYSHVTFPKVSDGEDQYLYLACIKGGYRYEYAHAENVFFKLPDNFEDYKKYAIRIFQTQIKFGDVFTEKLVRTEHSLPIMLKIRGCIYAFMKYPFFTLPYIILHMTMQQWALSKEISSSPKFETSTSTKNFSITNQ